MKCEKIVVFGVFNCQTLEKLEKNTIKIARFTYSVPQYGRVTKIFTFMNE
jgi:hypothetical protein